MLFQTNAVTGADSRKLCGLLIVKMANVFGQAGQGTGLTNDKQRLRQRFGSKTLIQLDNKPFIGADVGQAAIGFFSSDFIEELLQVICLPVLFAEADQLNGTTQHQFDINDFTDDIRVFCRVDVQQVETGVHIDLIRAARQRHRFGFRNMVFAFFITLPRATVVAAEEVITVEADFFRHRFQVGGKAKLIPVVNVTRAKLICINLVAAGNKHQRQVFFFTQLKTGLN
ncbi:Uncharacterised protein [Klebsiella pneumoniae]|nr:Uncharacterised protein [Klebsiella pneumoniae]